MTVSEQIADLKATFVAELDKSNKASQVEISRLQGLVAAAEQSGKDASARIAELENQISAKDAEISKLQGEVTAANEGKAASDKELGTLKARNTELEGKEQDLEKRANLKATGILQQRGITAPLGEERRDNPATEKTPAGSGLKGMARVQAMIAAELEKK